MPSLLLLLALYQYGNGCWSQNTGPVYCPSNPVYAWEQSGQQQQERIAVCGHKFDSQALSPASRQLLIHQCEIGQPASP